MNSRTAGVMGKALIPPDLEMYMLVSGRMTSYMGKALTPTNLAVNMLVSGGIEVDPKSKTNLMRV